MRLYGGFAGGESFLAERDWSANGAFLDGRAYEGGEERVYHVVTASDDAVLDGFRVVYGLADGSGELRLYGGGLLADSVSPVVRHCVFRENAAAGKGGAIAVHDGSPVVSDCLFSANAANTAGGAIYVEGGAPTIVNCAFAWNQAASEVMGIGSGWGGAVYVDGDTSITNCTFYWNSAGVESVEGFPEMGGGAVYVANGVTCTIANSAFWENKGLYCSYYFPHAPPSCGWADDDLTAADGWWSSGDAGPESWPGVFEEVANVRGDDPMFADAPEGDLHLLSGSPCIDAANGALAPTTDVEGFSRYDDPDVPDTGGCGDAGPGDCVEHADVGAYEFLP
jgi:predicted outer membrane repeat protein